MLRANPGSSKGISMTLFRERAARILVVLVSALACAGRLIAQTLPAEAPPAADQVDEAQALIDSLLDDLTGADDAARQKAQKQLVGMGDLAIAPLQTYLRGAHLPISKQRVQAVLDELETHFKFQPTLVTIKMDNVHPREVFKEFSKQSGVAIEPQWDFWTQGGYGNLPKKVSIDIKDQPFWPALLDFCAKAKVNINNGGNGSQISLYPGDNGQYSGPRFVSGPIVFVLSGVYRNIYFNGGKPNRNLNIQFQALMDPKLNVLDGSYEVKLSKADGDKGTSLVQPTQNENSRTGGNGWQWYLSAPLTYASGDNTKVAVLKGSARYRIRSGTQKLEIDDVQNAAGKTASGGGYTLTFNSIKPMESKNSSWEVSFTLASDKQPEPGIGFDYPQANAMHLYGADGVEWRHNSMNMNGGPKQMQITMHYTMVRRGPATQPVGEPKKFVLEVSTGTRNIRVPVEFSDIPLPGQEPK